MALLSRHRKPSDHASAHRIRILSRVCPIALSVDDQPHGCWDNPGHHTCRGRDVFLTLATKIYYNCPYRTPSIIAGTVIKYLSHSHHVFPVATTIHCTLFFHRKPQENSQVASLRSSPCDEGVRLYFVMTAGTEHIPLVTVMAAPARIFEETAVDWGLCRADVCCISWLLNFTTDIDIIFSTVSSIVFWMARLFLASRSMRYR